jgi:putative flippase GtrA
VGHLLHFQIQPSTVTIFRYLFVGATAAAIDIGIFGILAITLGFPWFPVAAFSFVLATTVNYYLSIRYVFSSGARFTKKNEIIMVFLVSALGLTINQTVLWVLIENLRSDPLPAKLAATGTVFFWNYLIRKNYIFRSSARGNNF